MLQMSKIWTPQGSLQRMSDKCDEKSPDNMKEDCLKEIICPIYQQDHFTYSRSCDLYQKKKKRNT